MDGVTRISPPGSTGPAVEAAGLGKRFGTTRALAGLDLMVPAGTVYGLLGPNGAGKTTTVRILATLLAPDAGTARVLGHDVVSEAAAVRREIALAGSRPVVGSSRKYRPTAAIRLAARSTRRRIPPE